MNDDIKGILLYFSFSLAACFIYVATLFTFLPYIGYYLALLLALPIALSCLWFFHKIAIQYEEVKQL